MLLILLLVAFVFSDKVDFSMTRGFYTNPFSLELKSSKFQIKYIVATPGSLHAPPTTVYTAPIPIAQSAIVTAIAFNSSYTSKEYTHTYIFPEEIPDKPYMYKPNVDSIGKSKIVTGLLKIPSFSLSSVHPYPTDFNSPSCDQPMPQCVTYPPGGIENRRNSTIEWLDPLDPKNNWEWPTQFDVYGGSSKTYIKKGLRFYFPEKLEVAGLFDGFDSNFRALNEFHSIEIRHHSADGAYGNSHYGGFNKWGSYLKNFFADYTSTLITGIYPHSRLVHLYYNGDYTGLFHLRERFDKRFWTGYVGLYEDSYEYITSERKSAENRPLYPTYYNNYETAANQNFVNLDKYTDWDHFFNLVAIQNVGRNSDLANQHNYQTIGPRLPKTTEKLPWINRKGFKFFPNDQDLLFSDDYPISNPYLAGTFNSLIAEKHPNFMIKFHDMQYQLLLKNGSLYSIPSATKRMQEVETVIYSMESIVSSETARWGFAGGAWWYKNNSYYTMDNWLIAKQRVYDYITINVNSCIQHYINQGLLLIARIRRSDGVWGPKDSILVKVGNKLCSLCKKVIFTEINYKPYKFLSKNQTKKSHFIEIKNIGTEDVSLAGSYISLQRTYNLSLPAVILPKGKLFVIGLFDEDFKLEYSKYPDHLVFTQFFKGDSVALFDEFDNIVHRMTFNSNLPWSELANGYGHSLVVSPKNYQKVAFLSDAKPEKQFRYWRASTSLKGSPGVDDPEPPASRDITIKFNYVEFTEGWVEFYNPLPTSVDISSWVLRDRYEDESGTETFKFPEGTTIKGNSYFKQVLPKKFFSRKHNPILFRSELVENEMVSTGDFLEFVQEDNELSLNSKRNN